MKINATSGDRVRLTLEGFYVETQDDRAVFSVDGWDGPFTIMTETTNHPSFRFEVLAKPLQPGERARHKYLGAPCMVLAVHREMAFIRWANDFLTDEEDYSEDSYVVVPLRLLERP